MSLPHILGRLARMSGAEIYTRGRQQAAKHTDVLLHRLGLHPFRMPLAGAASRGAFFVDPAAVPQILDRMRRRMPGQVEAIVTRAEHIVSGRFDLLGYTNLSFGSPIDWSLDPVHRKCAPSAPWSAISFLDFSAIGDHKVIWELSRLQFLVTLAKAWRLTGDRRFADTLIHLWRDWRRGNPYPVGVNWASTLEVAFRSLSLMWSAFLLEGTAVDSPALQRDFTVEIARGAWYIHRYLSTYFSPNTHLLGEGVALLLIALRFPGLPASGLWRQVGWRIALEEARHQVRSDGLHFEQSIYYHVYALDFFLHARLLASRNGMPIPAGFDETIHRMAAALQSLSQAGALPRFGDDDGGRLFDPSRNRPEHMLDPLSTAAVLFREPSFKTAARDLREETLWLFGPEGAAAFDSLPSAPPSPGSRSLPAAGIYAMTSPGPPAAQLFIDAGEIGSLSAGHGHADALSVQLAVAGRLWLMDPGTGAYVGAGSVRETFRGTAAHSTLTVDARDQADPAGPFSWGPLPRVEPRAWVAGQVFDFFAGCHSGYQRLSSPVTHCRFVLRWGSGFWLVRDVAAGSGAHRFDVRWRFAPEASVTAAENAVISHLDDASLAILPSSSAWECAIDTGACSPAYGASVPAPVVRFSHSLPCPAEFAVVLRLGTGHLPQQLRFCVSPAHAAAAYVYSAGTDRRWIFFALQDGHPWSAGEWSSDAAVLCYAPGELFLIGATYVDYAGNRVIGCPRKMAGLECRLSSGQWTIPPPEVEFHPAFLPGLLS